MDVQDDHAELVREIGAKSTVLLKNVNGSLPLRAPRSVILIGSDAGPPRRGPNGYPDVSCFCEVGGLVLMVCYGSVVVWMECLLWAG